MRRPLDLSLYLVTDTALCARRGLAETVRQAVAAGVTVVQLRDPDADDQAVVAMGRRLREVLAGTGVPLLVNDRPHLVAEIGADGAHVGQGDTEPVAAREALGADRYLGLSVHDLGQLERASALPEGTVDYLGVGPVWSTATKPAAEDAIGVEGVAELALESRWPCVAIGGIDAARASDLRERVPQLAGVAVVSAICAADDVAAATGALRDRP
ncbi:thiamine phosphate synthase [Ornithinicoccus halotolerans]|uniref:thiamine phosphate synthase n=1 Tax=Ornithinicoccus halotolerans TaxID=1748220 RepID=UPI001E597FDB|nr:thiamine phosphate synthase [Ornithinicoccus halotolerans]